jgi:hypothetical protein
MPPPASDAAPVAQSCVERSHVPCGHCASLLHRTQRPPDASPSVSQTCPGHSASLVHPRQVELGKSQTGVACVQAAWFVASHATHAPALEPLVTHTLPHSMSLVHARHVLLVKSQKGVVALQRVELVPSHWTHEPALGPVFAQTGVAPLQSLARQARQVPPTSQKGVAPVHGDGVEPSHCTQAPAFRPVVLQRGVAPPQSAGVHARHIPLAVSQTGAVLGHVLLVEQRNAPAFGVPTPVGPS